jgi:cyanophycin synthetase
LVFLTSASNMHQGGDIVDATDAIHRSYVELVERAMNLMPGVVFCGPDVLIQDAGVPATADNYHFLEVNSGPGFAAHHNPWCGQPRDVAGNLIDYLTNLKPHQA